MLFYLIAVPWATFATAAVLTTPTPTVTVPAALYKREITTVGYYSTGSQDGTTLWGTVTYETEGAMVGTSGSQFALCASNSCAFGSCSGGTYIMSTTAVPCGPASSSTCSSNLLYTDVFDTAPLTNFFCDKATETGFVLYKKTPGPADSPNTTPARSTPNFSSIPSSSLINSLSTSATLTQASIQTPSSVTSVPTTGISPQSTTSKKSTPIGAIVGGAIGGVAVIGALVVAAIVLIRRRGAAPSDQIMQTAPPPQESKPYVGMAVAPPVGKMPDTTVYPYPAEVGDSSIPQSPAPQYSLHNGGINELPTQRH